METKATALRVNGGLFNGDILQVNRQRDGQAAVRTYTNKRKRCSYEGGRSTDSFLLSDQVSLMGGVKREPSWVFPDFHKNSAALFSKAVEPRFHFLSDVKVMLNHYNALTKFGCNGTRLHDPSVTSKPAQTLDKLFDNMNLAKLAKQAAIAAEKQHALPSSTEPESKTRRSLRLNRSIDNEPVVPVSKPKETVVEGTRQLRNSLGINNSGATQAQLNSASNSASITKITNNNRKIDPPVLEPSGGPTVPPRRSVRLSNNFKSTDNVKKSISESHDEHHALNGVKIESDNTPVEPSVIPPVLKIEDNQDSVTPAITIESPHVSRKTADEEFQVGDLAWARVGRHPFWPCVVLEESQSRSYRKYLRRRIRPLYHVRFFGDNGRRAWVSVNNLMHFHTKNDLDVSSSASNPAEQNDEHFVVNGRNQRRWKMGVKEAESMQGRSVAEKEKFFFDNFTSHRTKKKKKKRSADSLQPPHLVVDDGPMQLRSSHGGSSQLNVDNENRTANSMHRSDFIGNKSSDGGMGQELGRPQALSGARVTTMTLVSKEGRKSTARSSDINSIPKTIDHPDIKSEPMALDIDHIKLEAPLTRTAAKNAIINLLNESECNSNVLDKSHSSIVDSSEKIEKSTIIASSLQLNKEQSSNKSKQTQVVSDVTVRRSLRCTYDNSQLGTDVLSVTHVLRLSNGGTDNNNGPNLPSTTDNVRKIVSMGTEYKLQRKERRKRLIDIRMKNLSHRFKSNSQNQLTRKPKTIKPSRSKLQVRILRHSIESRLRARLPPNRAVRHTKLLRSLVAAAEVNTNGIAHADAQASTDPPKTARDQQETPVSVLSVSSTEVGSVDLSSSSVSECSQSSSSEDRSSAIPNTVSALVKLYHSNNLLRGISKEHVCRLCANITDVATVQCTGRCHTYYHLTCASDLSGNKLSLQDRIDLQMQKLMEHPNPHLVMSDLRPIETMCRWCFNNQPVPCFACQAEFQNWNTPTDAIELSSQQGDNVRKCSVTDCGRPYHPTCLEKWPQVQNERNSNPFKEEEIDKVNNESFVCPVHVCHACWMAGEPCSSPVTIEKPNKLIVCIRCPAAFHASSVCIPAGSKILTQTQLICPRHLASAKVPPINTSWCFICSKGGNLVCCDTCPTCVHIECLSLESRCFASNAVYYCEDCQNGRFPLYHDVVWAKLGSYRWWPGVILLPSEIPPIVSSKTHVEGEFVIKFFGTYDHSWTARGKVFQFQEGDTGGNSHNHLSTKKKMEERFLKAVQEANIANELRKQFKWQRLSERKLKPPSYTKIRVNKPVGNVRLFDPNTSNTTSCNCDPNTVSPCGPDSDCLNRLLLTECNPDVCPAGERCENRAFEKREYPALVPCHTGARGWGLKTLVDLRKGQFVIEYVGEMINDKEYQRRVKRMHEDKVDNYYFLVIDNYRMLDAGPKGNVARFMNHSCQPNCETQKWTVNGQTRVGLFATHDISAGTELTFNYNLESIGKEMKICQCGAPNCSGFIGVKVKSNGAGNGVYLSDDNTSRSQTPTSKSSVSTLDLNHNKVRTKSAKRSSGAISNHKRKSQVKAEPTSAECFVCGLSAITTELRACIQKQCSKYYHDTCLSSLEMNVGTERWICPWHNCKFCSKRTIRCCYKCLNSYCPAHSKDNIRFDKTLHNFMCTLHDPEANVSLVNPHLDGNNTTIITNGTIEANNNRNTSTNDPPLSPKLRTDSNRRLLRSKSHCGDFVITGRHHNGIITAAEADKRTNSNMEMGQRRPNDTAYATPNYLSLGDATTAFRFNCSF